MHRCPSSCPHPQSGLVIPTTKERKVAELVAERLTNRQVADRLYISARTVETHLAHMLAKANTKTRGS